MPTHNVEPIFQTLNKQQIDFINTCIMYILYKGENIRFTNAYIFFYKNINQNFRKCLKIHMIEIKRILMLVQVMRGGGILREGEGYLGGLVRPDL